MSMLNTTKRVKEIRRKTRRKFSSEEKIRIVLDGLRGEGGLSGMLRAHPLPSQRQWHQIYPKTHRTALRSSHFQLGNWKRPGLRKR